MNNGINNNHKIKTALLGATGIVGQAFIHLLSRHENFELSVITGSEYRKGKRYGDSVQWKLPVPLPKGAADLTIETLDIQRLKEENIRIIFSALPSDTAQVVERQLVAENFYVFSNAGALRYDENVPILIPEVNPESLRKIENQGFPQKGFVITNANCSTTGLAVALAPLEPFGIKEVFVSTYQSVSGAGYPGLSSLDIMGNAVPYIPGEEEKIIKELRKIFQRNIAIFPHCVRIPVLFGHQETVWLTLESNVGIEDVREAWETYLISEPLLPSLPEKPVAYLDGVDQPQPNTCFQGDPSGMQVFTGRLREVNGRIGFNLVVNNLIKGAAGGSIANAELFLKWYGNTTSEFNS